MSHSNIITMPPDIESSDDERSEIVHVIEGKSELPAGTNIGIQNSKDVHFGNKTYVHSRRVVIKQIVKDNRLSDNEDKTMATSGQLQEQFTLKKTIVGLMISAVLLITSFISLLIYYLERPATGGLRMISSKEWLAQPFGTDSPLLTPVPYVIVSHTVTEQCTNQATCTISVRKMKASHERNLEWSDIAYNFLVGGDGAVYEGRSWDTIGAHTYGFNRKSIGIAMIGTFINVKPPERQLKALKDLIELGVKLNKIDKDYKLLSHKKLISTSSPTDMLFNTLQTLGHFSLRP